LTDVTMARLARIANPMAQAEVSLTPEDAEALDAFVAAEFRVGKVPASLRPRAEKLESMVQLLAGPAPESFNAMLVERTMRTIATSRPKPQDSQPLRATGGFRFADLVSVAAVLLMGVAVMWPVLSTVRGYSQRSDCATNFAGIASAMGLYSSDNRDQFPMAAASFGGSWLNVGSTPDRSNAANLFTLARTKYLPLDTLACSGNPTAKSDAGPDAMDWGSLPEVSYSYYIMFGKNRPSPMTSPETIILADRSPVVLRAASNESIPFPEENSPNHRGQGQWGLRADGSSQWLTSPQVGQDNIWLSGDQERFWNLVWPHLPAIKRSLPKNTKTFVISIQGVPPGPLMQGNELPASEADSFLGP
jgi:hypothetical protein